jgi:hypothetical protein
VAIKVQSCNCSPLAGMKSKVLNFGRLDGVVSVQCLKWGRMLSCLNNCSDTSIRVLK